MKQIAIEETLQS